MKLSNFLPLFAVATAVSAGPTGTFKATSELNQHFSQYFQSVVSGIKVVGAQIGADTSAILKGSDDKRDAPATDAATTDSGSTDLPESVKTAVERFFHDNINDLYLIAKDFKLDFEEFLKPFIHD